VTDGIAGYDNYSDTGGMTKTQLTEQTAYKIADNWFLAGFHEKQGNADLAKNIRQWAVGVLDFARELGLNMDKVKARAMEIYKERVGQFQSFNLLLNFY
jgi:hypothetical protein